MQVDDAGGDLSQAPIIGGVLHNAAISITIEKRLASGRFYQMQRDNYDARMCGRMSV